MPINNIFVTSEVNNMESNTIYRTCIACTVNKISEIMQRSVVCAHKPDLLTMDLMCRMSIYIKLSG